MHLYKPISVSPSASYHSTIFLMTLWRIVVVPATDAAIGSAMAAAIDIATLAWLTTLFAGFYMGGHTIKAGLKS